MGSNFKLPLIVMIAVVMVLVVSVLPAINVGVNGGNNWNLTSAITYLNNAGYTAWATGTLTPGGVPVAQIDGTLATDSGLTYNSGTDTLTTTNISAPTGRTATYVIAPYGYTGGQADMVATNTDANKTIQTGITAAGVNATIRFLPGAYSFTNCIKPLAGQTFLCDGAVFTMANAAISLLTANVGIGDTAIPVTDGTKFYAGQWIAITDSSAVTISRGGITFKLANCTTVASVVGNTVNLSVALAVAYTTVQSAFMTTAASIITIENVDDVSVIGGTFNGNKVNQSQIELIALSDMVGDDLRVGGCIGAFNANNLRVEHVTAYDAEMFNIAMKDCDSSIITKNRVYGAYFKNILGYSCNYMNVTGNFAYNSQGEDGIALYSSNYYSIVSNNIVYGNARHGILIGSGLLTTVSNNFVQSPQRTGSWTQADGKAIAILNSASIVVEANVIDAGGYGISIETVTYSTFKNNIIKRTLPGYSGLINISGASNHIQVSGGSLDNIDKTKTAINLGVGGGDSTGYVTVSGVEIVNSSVGIAFTGTQANNTVINNTFFNNTSNIADYTKAYVNGNNIIAPGEIRTITGTLAGTTATTMILSLDNPFGQQVSILSIDLITTTASAASGTLDAGTYTGTTGDTFTAKLFTAFPTDTTASATAPALGNSVKTTTTGTQTIPVVWDTGANNRYLNFYSLAATTSWVSRYVVTVMGN